MNIKELTDEQIIEIKKADFSWGWFLFWCLVFNAIGAIGYVLHYLNRKSK